ncbi:MAG: zinc metalloprotease [Chitinophagaceae bacterium]
MKRSLVLLAGVFLFMTGCKKQQAGNESTAVPAIETVASGRKCATQDLVEEQMKADPTTQQRRNQIEDFINRAIANPAAYRVLSNGTIQIPVVVNVLYNTASQNISLAQIQSQIEVLNNDFSARNDDYSSIPAVFQAVRAGNTHIEFVLQLPVNRRETNKTKWQLNNTMKKNQSGGIDATDLDHNLNIWVCNLTSGYLGFSYYPGTAPAGADGVVVDDNAFGTMGSVEAPYDKGRTATHEVGHWMNLAHMWGDATCGTDLVNDTPPHRTYNFGCPGVIPITCTNNSTTNPFGFPREMTMNYMDYTEDACMFMFTAGQKARMLAIFAPGGPRNLFAQP